MSAFHRVDDIRTMPALRLVNFALRLPAYKGVLRALVEAEALAESKADLPEPARGRPTSSPLPGGDVRRNRELPSDAATLMTDPAFAGLFEKGGQA